MCGKAFYFVETRNSTFAGVDGMGWAWRSPQIADSAKTIPKRPPCLGEALRKALKEKRAVYKDPDEPLEVAPFSNRPPTPCPFYYNTHPPQPTD
eukprot:g3583.t1